MDGHTATATFRRESSTSRSAACARSRRRLDALRLPTSIRPSAHTVGRLPACQTSRRPPRGGDHQGLNQPSRRPLRGLRPRVIENPGTADRNRAEYARSARPVPVSSSRASGTSMDGSRSEALGGGVATRGNREDEVVVGHQQDCLLLGECVCRAIRLSNLERSIGTSTSSGTICRTTCQGECRIGHHRVRGAQEPVPAHREGQRGPDPGRDHVAPGRRRPHLRADYDSLEATAHLLRAPANANRLLESVQQALSGQRAEHELSR